MSLAPFISRFPLWVLVRSSCIEIRESGAVIFTSKPEFVMLETTKGDRSLPVFTNPELADGFVESLGDDTGEIIGVHDQRAFLETVKELRAIATWVIFNPETATGLLPRSWPIEIVIQGLEANATAAN